MTRERRGGLPKSSGETKIGRTQKETDLGETNVGSGEQSKQPPMALFVGLGLVIITTLGGSYFLINAPSIELICRQMGNCQKFKEDSNKAQESLNKAEKSFKSKNSLPELLAASKSIDEAKTILSAIPDNAKDLVTPIAEQRTKIAELDKKIAILLAVEENADKALKEAIAKIANADQLDRYPQGKTEPPETAKSRLAKPKALYSEAQVLLKSIPDSSLVANDRKDKLKQVTDKIKDLDGKIGAIAALDPCVLNPSSCKPVDPCVANPSACVSTPATSVPKPEPPVQWTEPQQPDPPPPSKRPLWGPGSSGY